MGNSRSKANVAKASASDDQEWFGGLGGRKSDTFSRDRLLSEKTLTPQEYENYLRVTGNNLFKERKYAQALDYYDEIIQRNKSNPIAYTNRANAYMKLLRFEEAAEDCRVALTLESESVKANYYLGQCLCEMKCYEMGLWHLGHSLNVNLGEGGRYAAEIASKLKKCQRDCYADLEEAKRREDRILQNQLSQLIINDKEEKMHALNRKKQKYKFRKRTAFQKLDNEIQRLDTSADMLLQQTEDIFERMDQYTARPQIPDYMLCKISLLVMRDPVITPCGITYDRQEIEEHLDRGHLFDPTTRQPLSKQDLVPNLALKEAIEAFVAQNYWVVLDDDYPDAI